MADDEVQYERQSMKVIRGREASKIAEMQKQRWELVSQTQGKLRSELAFRRVKKRSFAPWMGAVALLGVGVIAFAVLAFGGDGSPEPKDPTSAAGSASEEPSDETSESPSEEASDAQTETPSEEPSSPSESPSPTEVPEPSVDAILTVQNNADLRALLKADDDYSLNQAFAKNYRGREIQFDGSAADATPGYYLVYFGDDSNTTATSGPAFQFRVQNLQADGRPVETGDNLRFTAEVGAFNADQGLFFLTPVKITAR